MKTVTQEILGEGNYATVDLNKTNQHSPFCAGTPRYYDGALGYEAMRCDLCGYEQDLNEEANAKATAERLARQWPTKAAQKAYWQRKADDYEAYLNELHARQQDPEYIASYAQWLNETQPLFADET